MKGFSVQEIPSLIISIVIVFLVGTAGIVYNFREINSLYISLPGIPSLAFGPIWIALYFLMGISLFLVWREGLDRKDVRVAVVVFAVQLVINVIWSLVFFGGTYNIFGGLLLLLVLWISIIGNIFVFYRISKPAGLILIPYLIWVSIAFI